MGKKQLSEAASVLGKRSYQARLQRLGIERLRAIARENGKLGGRPPRRKAGDQRSTNVASASSARMDDARSAAGEDLAASTGTSSCGWGSSSASPRNKGTIRSRGRWNRRTARLLQRVKSESARRPLLRLSWNSSRKTSCHTLMKRSSRSLPPPVTTAPERRAYKAHDFPACELMKSVINTLTSMRPSSRIFLQAQSIAAFGL